MKVFSWKIQLELIILSNVNSLTFETVMLYDSKAENCKFIWLNKLTKGLKI